jgi:hypothetical protein
VVSDARQHHDQRDSRQGRSGAAGSVLHVTLKGTESKYTVGPEVPVLANGPGDVSLLKRGVGVFVIALKHEDGKLTSARLYAEKDSTKPPL